MLRRDVISLSLIKSPVLRAGAQSDEVLTLVDKAGSRECTSFVRLVCSGGLYEVRIQKD
jgi:hypothetical protein